MEVLYKKIQTISLLLTLIFLFQSCYVYQKASINPDKAVAANGRMKVITTDNKKYKFLKIKKKDSTYYGITKMKGQIVNIPLEKENMKSIHPVNKTNSTILTVGTVLLSAGTVIIIIGILTFDYEANPDTIL
ncbi:MAG TPA: hypothetical protein VLB74_00215 [Flavobacterium sp.]|uniref:hypothetical protein n=1 Tax=Flavobacterium sp. TaxID=239 RepID=UPI002B93D35D|nr:hypothetical protein [Flavobacterium sp.]HSD13048.1 hypothetical protein [Flavobacterium sp.]